MVANLIVALDVPDLDEAVDLSQTLAPIVGGFKVGLELMMGHGPRAITAVAETGLPVFADAKLHDIPNTVLNAAKQIRKAGARWVTVHASGGGEMIRAAVEGMDGEGVLPVTVLTSLDSLGLAQVGISHDLDEQVGLLVALASEGGAEGVVCSPEEVMLAKSTAPHLKVFTPGIRPEGVSKDDQKRVATPVTALRSGSDYLIVGRAITKAPNVRAAAESIAESIARATNSAFEG